MPFFPIFLPIQTFQQCTHLNAVYGILWNVNGKKKLAYEMYLNLFDFKADKMCLFSVTSGQIAWNWTGRSVWVGG
jgi:hypothetical protein